VSNLLESWNQEFKKTLSGRVRKQRASFVKIPAQDRKRILKIQTALRDYHHLEDMFLQLRELKVLPKGKKLEKTAVGGSKHLKTYLEQN
jgi:hypothetical protein